jgi:hypothetical protein
MSVTFSIRELVVEGQLAGIRPGDPRELVRAELGPPDEWNANSGADTATIWRYGNFEVHFAGDVVWMLFNDYLDSLDAGPGRDLDPWIIQPAAVPGPDEILQRLHADNVPFVVGRDVLDRRVVWIDSGACLAFDRDEEDGPECWFAIEVLSPSRAPNFTPEPTA